MSNYNKFGDWKKAGIFFEKVTNLNPIFEAQLYENGKLVLKKLVDHIDNQDLNWTPLSKNTIRIKGSTDIYIETGWLKENLGVRKVKSSKGNISLFIGASPWKKHKPSGLKFSDLMIYLEYGTNDGRIPARPILRPTMDEIEKELSKDFLNAIMSYLN